MNSGERIRVSLLVRNLDALKQTSPAMPLQHAVSFLHVALEPGLSVTALAKATGFTVASSSRHVRALAGLGSGKHTPALLASDFGKDARTKAILLTDAGRSLLKTVLDSLSGTPAISKPTVADKPEPCPNNGSTHTHRAPPQRIPWDPFEGC
jgi:DNA-binding MarR family transcriptional regulator